MTIKELKDILNNYPDELEIYYEEEYGEVKLTSDNIRVSNYITYENDIKNGEGPIWTLIQDEPYDDYKVISIKKVLVLN